MRSRLTDKYIEHAVLQNEVANRLLVKLQDTPTLLPRSILNLGWHAMTMAQPLTELYPLAKVVNDTQAQYLSEDEYDLICSNLSLHEVRDIGQMLADCWQALRPQGWLLFSCIGIDSLSELSELNINPYPDIRDLGNGLHGLGFINALMYREKITMTYRDLDTLLMDLRVTGGRPWQPFRGLRTARWWQDWRESMQVNAEGVYAVNIDILYGMAQLPATKGATANAEGVAYIPLSRVSRSS